MIKKNKLVLINNEKVSKKGKNFYCQNIDIKSIPEGLSKNFELYTIVRKSNENQPHQMNVNGVSVSSNIFNFLYFIFKTFKLKQVNYLLVSLTPYTFIAYIFLFIFKKKIYIYFRSNGYEEYKAIFGFWGPLFYHFMFTIVTLRSNIISCQKKLIKKKECDLVAPSQLDDEWLKSITKPPLEKPRLLYVGRIKVEKGIFSLLKIFEDFKSSIELSIVGNSDEIKEKISGLNINLLGHGFDTKQLIDIYDKHNIFILPSFTEAHPQVIDESLARGRPIIIFEDIEHVIQNRIGIFVVKRNAESLNNTINFIIKNYLSIQEKMLRNKLPTKQQFILQITKILNKN